MAFKRIIGLIMPEKTLKAKEEENVYFLRWLAGHTRLMHD